MSDPKPYRLSALEKKRIDTLRADCASCGGDSARCIEGDENLDRLAGCKAFTASGAVAQLKPKQPWQAKPERHLKAA